VANCERWGFPFESKDHPCQRLEAGVVEEWLGGGSSFLVPSDVVHAVLAVHASMSMQSEQQS
jgi:hypothetical protein